MKMYVGPAKRRPDSRMPRRLPIMRMATKPEAQHDWVEAPVRQRGRDGCNAGRDADGDGQHVVDQQRGRGDERRQPAKVLLRDDVRAAAARVRVNRLAIRKHHDREHRRDDGADRRDEAERRDAADR